MTPLVPGHDGAGRVIPQARPLVSVLLVIPLMQYAVMPRLTRAARPFIYPARDLGLVEDAP